MATMLCRADNTFRFPRDFTNYDTDIVGGAVVRMQMTWSNGKKLQWSSDAGDGVDGVFTYDSGSKTGWFNLSLAKVADFYSKFYGSTLFMSPPPIFAINLVVGAGEITVLSGTARWSPPALGFGDVDTETATDTVGQTVFVEGEEDGVGAPLPVAAATVLTQAQAAQAAAAGSATAASGSATAAASSATAAASNAAAAASYIGAFRNRFRNPAFDVWQRGTSITVNQNTSIYTADGWRVVVNNNVGTFATVTKVAAPSGFRTPNAINIAVTGAAASGIVDLMQKIESQDIRDLDGKDIVVSFDMVGTVSAGTLAGVVLLYKLNTLDNWSGSITQLKSVAFSVPASGQTVTVKLPAANTVGVANGAIIYIRTTMSASPGDLSLTFGSAQIEADRLVGGVYGNPTSFEFRPTSIEYVLCAAHYQPNLVAGLAGYVNVSSQYVATTINLTTPMRAAPTATLGTGSNAGVVGSVTTTVINARSIRVQFLSTGAGAFTLNQPFSLSAEP